MREVPLTRGAVALVDDEDFDTLDGHRWRLQPSRGKPYAAAVIDGRVVMMHALLCPVPEGHEVDHRNGDGLDNRRANLRAATHRQNILNRRGWHRGAPIHSNYNGVSWDADKRKWRARINVAPGRQVRLGRFASEVEAARAYDAAAREHHGEFASLNFPG